MKTSTLVTILVALLCMMFLLIGVVSSKLVTTTSTTTHPTTTTTTTRSTTITTTRPTTTTTMRPTTTTTTRPTTTTTTTRPTTTTTTSNSIDTMSRALSDAEAFAVEFEFEYPDDYLTPNHLNEQLQYVLGYSATVANYAVENANINWKYHANQYAQVYLTYVEEFGRRATWWRASDIEDMLLNDGFSSEVVEAVMSTVDWDLQSQKYVKHLSDFYDTFNRLDARYYLEDIFASDDIDYLLENSGVDWKAHALNMANELWSEYIVQEYYKDQPIAYVQADIVDELSSIWEYTDEEIDYAIENMTIFATSSDHSQYLEYTLNSDNQTYSVTGIGQFGGEILEIPSAYNGLPVTSIGEAAFKGCTTLVIVTIPNSVTYIAGWAFYNCTSLASVTIGNSVTKIGYCTFSGCTSLTSIIIPDSVTNISYGAFSYCTSLSNVIISDSMKDIHASVFHDCASLTSIVIPDSVTMIWNNAFNGCTALTSITIPSSVTEIERDAFIGCISLTNVTFGGTVEQWNAIEKDYYWNINVPATEIVCSDGIVTLNNYFKGASSALSLYPHI